MGKFFAAFAMFVATSSSCFAQYSQYWLYMPANLLLDKEVEHCEDLLRRAAKSGYTHCLISDSKFCRLSEMPERYFKNANKVKTLARELKVELVPAVFPIGYSNDLLSQDPNLIEALPVRDLPMIVKNGRATVVDQSVPLKNPQFDSGDWDWHDETVQLVDGLARVENPNGKPARVVQKVKLQPFRQYHLSVRVRTKDFKGTPEVKFIVDGQVLNYDYLKVSSTQDWTEHHVVFNSLENSSAGLYLGCWDGQTGLLQWDDARLEQVAFLNLTRRPGTPLSIKRPDGSGLTEGTDFKQLVDPLMGTQPYAGVYTVYHEPPTLQLINIPDGTRLNASYFHGATVHDDQANICPSEPRTIELLYDHAKRVHELWQAAGYWMSHDEIRVYNWCNACRSRNIDSGEMLANNVGKCIEILRQVNPGGRIYVWSDMFDPHHNAKDKYYLARGSFENSWEGLHPDVIVVPWYFDAREKTLPFFADRGHRQLIAAYYDGPLEQVAHWTKTASSVPNIEGIMYTTWQRDYKQLEAFIERAKASPKK
jgi:hypothetical protein